MAIHVAIEGYDSLEQIGVGGMAAVYKARKTSIDKIVAIKVLFPYLAGDATFIERFQREAKAAASIQHDNVVNVIDYGETEGSCYIVMEYYDGRTLEDLMKSRPGVPSDVAAQILLEVAYGLEAAHARDLVHRDVKPANIIYTSQGGIKIADFGLAKKSDSATMITQHGKVIGTPAYMSPEQAAGRPVGPASDIFSLGVVAYELLGRRKPFEGNTYSEVIEKIQTLDPPAVTAVNPLIDPEFERVIARMLAKDDRERHANAGELIADLEAAMEKSGIERDRRRLADYIRDPDAYDARANEKTITQCLSRGAFFMQKGQGHLDDALLEFRRILFLDPTNARARRNVARIRSRRGDQDKTVTIDAAPGAATAAATAAREPARDIASGRSGLWPRRRLPAWMYVAGVAGVTALVAAMLWYGRGARNANGVGTEAPFPAALSDSPLMLFGSETAATTADSAAHARRAGETAKNGTGAPREDVKKVEPVRITDSTAAVKKAEPSPAQTERKTDATASVPAKLEPRPAQPVRTGTLSVFFLGGVGEVMIDGKRFAHQPPFEGVVMPAGRYRVACRMSGDTAPREIVVTIAPDRETVIEYEVGGEPVATTGE